MLTVPLLNPLMKNPTVFLTLLLYLSVSKSSAQLIFHADFNEQSGSSTTVENISGNPFTIINLFDKPERISAPNNGALRLDGWSTYIESPSFTLEGINRQMTIEAWYATEAFNKESSSIIELFHENSGFYLSIGAFGELNFAYHLDNNFYVHNTTNRLTPYYWHHIVTTIDLDAGETKIYVNGELWFLQQDLSESAISIPESTLYIGKRNLDQQSGGFQVNVLNGALDDIKIYNQALTEAAIQSASESVTDRSVNLYIDPQVRHLGDHLRPQYHPMPNTGWANEAYGLMYYQGNYHLFFQKNPNAPQLYFMHWGHLVSPDLVHWREVDITLRPSPGFDNFGTWSGTTIKTDDGQPMIFYTGVDGARAGIGSATSESNSLLKWHENENNPLIPSPPSTFSHMDFRDPYIWKDKGVYYMIVGSGLQNEGGGILFTYKSTDLESWTLIPALYSNNDVDTYGVFWEMPSMVRLEDNIYLLQLLPTPYEGKPARSLYLIGTWENEKFTPFSHQPNSLELFDSHLLAPAIGVDEETENTYIGIIPEDRSVEDQIAAGWRQTFSIPRQFRYLEDSTIGQIPHPNLCRLRSDEITIENLVLENEKKVNLPEFGGNQVELEFNILADSNSVFAIQVLKHEDEQEYTTITFNYELNKIILDRRQSSLSSTRKDSRIGDFVFNPNDTLNVRIFIDHSTLEVFIQNLTVFSSRVYPSRVESDNIDIVAIEGSVEVIKASLWQMGSMLDDAISDASCMPENLPKTFNKAFEDKKKDPLGMITPKSEIIMFPNPSNSFLNIKSQGRGTYVITNLLGQVVSSGQTKKGVSTVDLNHLDEGVYVVTAVISQTQHSYSNKVLIKR